MWIWLAPFKIYDKFFNHNNYSYGTRNNIVPINQTSSAYGQGLVTPSAYGQGLVTPSAYGQGLVTPLIVTVAYWDFIEFRSPKIWCLPVVLSCTIQICLSYTDLSICLRFKFIVLSVYFYLLFIFYLLLFILFIIFILL